MKSVGGRGHVGLEMRGPHHLDVLRRALLLEAAPDPAFDRLTRMARALVDVPAVAVCVLGPGAPFLKSFAGDAGAHAMAAPALAIARRATKADAVREVTDVREDGELGEDLEGLGWRAALATPLGALEGAAFGALIAFDTKPRRWSDDEAERLLDAAAALEREIDIRVTAAEDSATELIACRSTLAAIGEGVCVCDADGVMVSWNPSAERILGLSEASLLGSTTVDYDWMTIHEDGTHWPGDTHPMMVTLHTGLPQSDVVMGIRKETGEVTWISVDAQPVAVPGRKKPGVVATFADITRPRRVLAQQAAIARLGQLAMGGIELPALLHQACASVTDALNVEYVVMLELGDDGLLRVAGVAGEGLEPVGTTVVLDRQERAVLAAAWTSTQPVVIDDWLTEERFRPGPELVEQHVRSTTVLAIRQRDRPWGIVVSHSRRPGHLSEDGVSFLDAVGSFLATAVERRRTEAEIAALAQMRGRLVAETLAADERARGRISENLHDGALQDLLAARQDLVEAEAAGSDDDRRRMAGVAREGIERAVRRLREAVQDLHPVTLQHGGLGVALQAAAEPAARQGGFIAEIELEPAAAGVCDELVLSLARELLTNAAKHAEADTVRVSVGCTPGAITLEVADDGRGAEPGAITSAVSQGHIGLASLTQRAEAVGGSLEIDSAPGRGTTARAVLPVG